MESPAEDIASQPQAIANASGASSPASITRLLMDVESGDHAAWDEIYRVLYKDIHRIATSLVRQQARKGHSPTSMISETWIRLARSGVVARSRDHLVTLIARAMRFVLVDQVRSALAGKRGSGVEIEAIAEDLEAPSAGHAQFERLLMLDSAFESLARINERLVRVVELRYFGGFGEAEIAELLGVNVRTVRRDWRKARAYLQKHLEPGISD